MSLWVIPLENKETRFVYTCMLFARHSEFCHQSFDIFVAHISVFIVGRVSIPQTFFLFC